MIVSQIKRAWLASGTIYGYRKIWGLLVVSGGCID
jgi:hypothetical protein